MRKKIGIGLAVALLLFCAACGKKEEEQTTEQTMPVPTTAQIEETQETTSPIAVIDTNMTGTEGKVKSKLSGQWVSGEIGNRRPIAVMLNNIKQGVPQSGIMKADVIYEVPVEGGITRLMGIFEDYDALEKIGSIRSCRLYYLYFAKEFDAIYVHWGQAKYAEDLLYSKKIDNLNGLTDTKTFYRTSDRSEPHNGYTSGKRILAGIENMGYRTEYEEDYKSKFIFAEDGKEITLDGGETAKMVYPGYSVNKPWFEYREEDGLYYRYEYGSEQIDESTDEQLSYKNIIIQINEAYDYGDGYYYVYTTGSGSGKYITNGKVIDITWKKDSDFGPTKYYDESGKEITLNQGKTWVSVIFKNRASQIDIQ